MEAKEDSAPISDEGEECPVAMGTPDSSYVLSIYERRKYNIPSVGGDNTLVTPSFINNIPAKTESLRARGSLRNPGVCDVGHHEDVPSQDECVGFRSSGVDNSPLEAEDSCWYGDAS
ncbi:hypothetical protein ANCCAN_13125 [Ancylostoma caninum]|uniref:Uncharacterized protein n=1 Tax=Ancylostoma caninum TaxID=29170 RepID=A0A368GB64_ANCCA|nr:hypothetical protein ANCCAN_13125 [Ancylostoma caninum]